MAKLVDVLIDAVLPNANNEVKQNISNLITDTLADPKNGFKKHIYNLFAKDFSEKHNGAKFSSFADILKQKFNISDADYEKIEAIGTDIFEFLGKGAKMGEMPSFAPKNSPFSYIEIYGAILVAILRYGLKKEMKRTFNDPESTDQVKLLVDGLADLHNKAEEKNVNADFIQLLPELLSLLFQTKNKQNGAPSIVELFKNDGFKDFLLSRNVNGDMNFKLIKDSLFEELFKRYAEYQHNQEAANSVFNVGSATDQNILGVECKLVRETNELSSPLLQACLTEDQITRMKQNGKQGNFLLAYICPINDMHGAILLVKKPDQVWMVEKVFVQNATNQEQIRSELHDLISMQLSKNLN